MNKKIPEITIQCESVTDAQQAAKFINDWQTLIAASWCRNELTIKVRVQHYDDHAYYEPETVCEHDFVKQVEVMKNGKILLRCTECPYLFVQDSLDSKPREPTPEDFAVVPKQRDAQ